MLTASNRKRLSAVLATVIAVLTLFFATGAIQPGHDSGDDFALYILEAKAITEGSLNDLAVKNAFCMEHSLVKSGPVLYPIGYPALLVPEYALRGLNFIRLKLINVILLAGCVFLIFYLFKFDSHPIILLTTLTILSLWQVEVITFPDQLLSEIPFLFFSLLTLLFMQRPPGFRNEIITAILIFITCLMRDAGMFLLPAWAVLKYMQYQKQQLSSKSPILFYWLSLPFLLFLLFFLFFPYGGRYHWHKIFSGLDFQHLNDNLAYYVSGFMQLLFKYDALWFRLVVIPLIVIGVVTRFRKQPQLAVFSGCLAGIAILWPEQMGVRPLIPLLPFVIFFMFHGLLLVAEKIFVKREWVMGFLVATTILSTYRNFMFTKERNETIVTNTIYTPEMISIYDWLTQNTPTTAVIGFEKPRALMLFTGRKCIHTNQEHFEKSVAEFLLLDKSVPPPGKDFVLFATANYKVYSKTRKIDD